MDRLLLSRPPLPVPAHAAAAAAADGDFLEFDVLWPAAASSTLGHGLLAALPEEEGKKKKKRAGPAGAARSAARPVPETAALTASAMARSAPVRIPSEPVAAVRRGRWAQAGAGGGEDVGEAMAPPHEIVARRAAAHSSVLEGAGRTLKGRDLRRVRNAVLRRTGFLD
ncbi:protein S40-7-like [Phragmites australis]|uniref:protein S40-7-like n=1 Tax=Phragmites australis TaxID=29695 RepID=UPI002D789B72|nr:protein S40-7-like [Phragmites australis]